MNLVVRYEENVDGGFLAPYGTYRSNLDYNTEIVRNLIIDRRLSPFYTPLQDFDESWTDDELLIILSQLSLHSIETAYSDAEEEDDVDNHKIHKSTNYYKRQEQKAKLQSLVARVKDIQKEEENRYLEEKMRLKKQIQIQVSPDIPSRDLLRKLYRNATECPICFLYYPKYLNVSRCCLQPICTECFVQIKRLDPHPPHDDSSNEPGSEELPHTLISEAASCPYCASPDFGVTYDPPRLISTGINGSIKAGNYIEPFQSIPEDAVTSSPGSGTNVQPSVAIDEMRVMKKGAKNGKRRASLAADAPGVITVDMIRPDWEQKLISARNKLARKAATASAIHASNLIINEEEDDPSNSPRRRRFSAPMARETSSNRSRPGTNSAANHLRTVEERMIEEALRLSLIDEEERKKKVDAEERKKNQSN
ncbi:uncharacterized protein RJT20DRAFT_114698 [Scheffersomyces xylosifermentans]|uniref:uncharacterized protein n=1 Tax=Scheffersomyces xylosifermentans TaxID=1304137 RepID=UPI00315C6F0E